LAELGFAAAELCLDAPHGLPLLGDGLLAMQHVVASGADSGCHVFSCSHHGDYTAGKSALDEVKKAVELAQATEGKVCVLSSPPRDKDPFGALWYAVVEALETLAETAAECGVTLAVEPEPGLCIASVKDTLALLAALETPVLAVNADIGHLWLTEPDLPAALLRLQGRIAHTHLTEIQDKQHLHLVPGQGDVPFAEAVAALRRAGYAGPLIIDLWKLQPQPRQTARRCLEGLRQALDDPGRRRSDDVLG